MEDAVLVVSHVLKFFVSVIAFFVALAGALHVRNYIISSAKTVLKILNGIFEICQEWNSLMQHQRRLTPLQLLRENQVQKKPEPGSSKLLTFEIVAESMTLVMSLLACLCSLYSFFLVCSIKKHMKAFAANFRASNDLHFEHPTAGNHPTKENLIEHKHSHSEG
ncbi:hypothetical protein HELRODRAFT_180934 [Helobdella robusta]|uniref:Uncharacterized protein n=1 Tax=Helobdella robusta TaxID=6412 RepID=T1FGG1_HELRO|nr:hypothetical protein HELRODRAFT_180934 [Helobdella robusta]ESN93404.1 hypothetical protein HELRODRAFT_180934 [Helobdella robusta]